MSENNPRVASPKPSLWHPIARNTWRQQEVVRKQELKNLAKRQNDRERRRNFFRKAVNDPLYIALLGAGAIDILPYEEKRAWGFPHRRWLIQWGVAEGLRAPIDDFRCVIHDPSDSQWSVIDEIINDPIIEKACFVLKASGVDDESRQKAQEIVDEGVANAIIKLKQAREDESALYRAKLELATDSLPPKI